MSAEDFQFVDDKKIDDSFRKRDFIKFYHQSGADVNNEISIIKFYFGENHIFIQIGNGNLEFVIQTRKAINDNLSKTAPGHDLIRLVNNAFAYTLHDARV